MGNTYKEWHDESALTPVTGFREGVQKPLMRFAHILYCKPRNLSPYEPN